MLLKYRKESNQTKYEDFTNFDKQKMDMLNIFGETDAKGKDLIDVPSGPMRKLKEAPKFNLFESL